MAADTVAKNAVMKLQDQIAAGFPIGNGQVFRFAVLPVSGGKLSHFRRSIRDAGVLVYKVGASAAVRKEDLRKGLPLIALAQSRKLQTNVLQRIFGMLLIV